MNEVVTNGLSVFENEQFGSVRVVGIEKDGQTEPWFVATDVCMALEISNPTVALERLDNDERSKFNLGRQGFTNIVNESGLYSLVLGSRKPEAKAFKRWITHEVIPSIRKHGGYIAGQEDLSERELLARAMVVANNVLAEREMRIAALTKENEGLAFTVNEMQPKVEYYDDLVDANGLTGIRETAKELGWQERKFVSYLLERDYMFRDKTRKKKLQPYAEHLKDGLFEVKECKNDQNGWAGQVAYIIMKGRDRFRSEKKDYFREDKGEAMEGQVKGEQADD